MAGGRRDTDREVLEPVIVDDALARRLGGALTDDLAVFVRGMTTADPLGGASRVPVAGGWACFTGLFGARVQGAGLSGPVDVREVDEAERFYDGVGSVSEFEICPLADSSLWRHLAKRGYHLVGFRNVYVVRPTTRAFGVIEIRRVRQDDFPIWSGVLLDGFGYRDADERAAVARWNRMVFDQPETVLFLAVVDGRPAGVANLMLHGDTASLGGTTTLPEFRRRGVQGALLQARLADATARGCGLAVVTADPGGGSARNIERAGFQLAYSNARLRRPGDPGSGALT